MLNTWRAAMRIWLSRIAVLAVAVTITACAAPRGAASPDEGSPRLVLLVAVDQLRYDYLSRFDTGFTGGFRRLLDEGAVFTNAHLGHYPSVTAVGHSAMLSGAPPSVSGIVGNDWYDRREGHNVTSVEDPQTTLVGLKGGGGERNGSSPHRLLVSTVADQLKLALPGSRAVGVSFKDRAAILPVGRSADLAFWWHTATGDFVTSTWYAEEMPGWAADFNARHPADQWLGREWRPLGGGAALATLPDAPGPDYYAALYNSPFGNELLEAFAEAALEGVGLGRGEGIDVLTVSFSSNDAVGHAEGPYAKKVQDLTLQTDRVVGALLEAVDRRVGLDRTVVILTADHGVSPVPEELNERRLPGGRFQRSELEEAARQALTDAHGPGQWIEGRAGSALYLNQNLIALKGLDPEDVEESLARGVEKLAPVWRAYTRTQLLEGRVPPDPWSHRVMISFNRERSGDVEILLEPYWMAGERGTTHGTPWSYDTHIPLILRGPGLRAGRYDRTVLLNDLAPTLATLLGVETPSGSSGQALVEALAH
jgi:predicted AlkP superfamily pyrophosphatase or phosphodiesterase